MLTITAVESIRFTQKVSRSWAERILTAAQPHRAGQIALLADRDLAAELAGAATHTPAIQTALEAVIANGAEVAHYSDLTITAATRGSKRGEEFAVHGGHGRLRESARNAQSA